MTVEFRILGPLEVLCDGTPAELGGPRQRALLALLLTRANTTVPRDRIIDELWGDEPPERVVNVLQTYVSRLRKELPPGRLASRAPGYVLAVERDELDLEAFERRVEEGRRSLSAGDAQAASESLRLALALWRGPALGDVGEAAFGRIESARLEELRVAAIEERIEAELALSRHAALVAELEALAAEHPLRERLRAQLMLALYRSGRHPEALAVYREARKRLIDELGVEPGHALRELESAILRQDASLDRPAHEAAGRPPMRSLLVVCLAEESLDSLLDFAAPLSERQGHELVLVLLVADPSLLPAAVRTANDRRAALAGNGIAARATAFTSAEPARDILRLVSGSDVALLALDAPNGLDGDGRLDGVLSTVLGDAPCDIALLTGSSTAAPADTADRIVVPFGGGEHEWAAVEIGAWFAQAERRPLRLVGTVGDPATGRRDASRLLASVALLVQRFAGVSTEQALADAGGDVAAFANGARVVLVGLPDDWRSRGVGRTRIELLHHAAAPGFLIRGGLRPGGLAPAESLTRFTWTLGDAKR